MENRRNVVYDHKAEKYISRLFSRDRGAYGRLQDAIDKICCNPEHSETLTGILSGYRSRHVGGRVIIYGYRNGKILIKSIDSHDKAYGLR